MILEKRGTECVHLWVKCFIQNVLLIVSRRKKLQNVSLWGLSFLCFWQNVYWSALALRNLPWPEKFLVVCLHSGIILFYKKLHLEYLTVFWIRLCLESCSVTCTVTLCYVLHQTHSLLVILYSNKWIRGGFTKSHVITLLSHIIILFHNSGIFRTLFI